MTKHDADGTTWHVFEDKGRKIMVKFDLDEPRHEPALPEEPETQPDPLHEQIEQITHVAGEAMKIESIRDRLGASVTYLEELLKMGDVLKDVSRLFQTRPPTDHKYSRRSTRSSAFP